MKYIAFDIETTGLNVKTDRMIQVGAILFDSETYETIKTYSTLVNPCDDFEIAEGAYEKCHISKEEVLEKGVPISEVISEIQKMFEEADAILTYNGNHFDIPFLFNEFARNGKMLQIPKMVYDSLQIEQRHNSNKLVDVYKRYYGKDYEDAHNALADVIATIDVFKKQVENYEDATETVEFISPENMLKKNVSTGNLEFCVGKHNTESVYDVCVKDPGYIKWLFEKYNGTGCSGFLKIAIKNEYERLKK